MTAPRGYLWEHLEEEIASEFDSLSSVAAVDYKAIGGLGYARRDLARSLRHAREWLREDFLSVVEEYSEIKRGRHNWGYIVERQLDRQLPPKRRNCKRGHNLANPVNVIERKNGSIVCKVCHRDLERERSRHMREKLPTDRVGVTQKFTLIARRFENGIPVGTRELKGYITASVYPDTREDGTPHPMAGRIGEVFVKIGKPGDEIALLDEWAMSVSRELQRGADPVEVFSKHRHSQFEPSGAVQGITGITRCSSPTDLVAQWVGRRFLGIDDKKEQP